MRFIKIVGNVNATKHEWRIGDTPLHVAARSRSKEIVSLFIDHARRDSQAIGNQDEDVERGITSKELQLVIIANNKNNTALHEALQYQTLSGIPQLLRSADPSFEYFANDFGETPLYLVVEHGSPALLEQILEFCPSQRYGAPGGRMGLHALALLARSSFRGKFSKSVYLLRHAAKEVDKYGRTALHYAVYSGNIEFVDAVVKVNPSVCYVSDKDGMTALHHAAAKDAQYWDSKKIMKIMLRHCPCRYAN
ncbi:serine/threonine-protein phosphatase 6 regulatory ankyrin repeat subunit B-like [Papaver somniferum]|uniref:serine/threonine-protein phosphatase 6 regulatory ankyrin repeat subunit B-like n=1 Tax=Papaver somniferum TaxID=3469 RepID=UPI000E6FB793|nr:serine/threonine-protein phosphatase 6 regulatory ankyrin repeat subunit B-like [Papaver somniferum]